MIFQQLPCGERSSCRVVQQCSTCTPYAVQRTARWRFVNRGASARPSLASSLASLFLVGPLSRVRFTHMIGHRCDALLRRRSLCVRGMRDSAVRLTPLYWMSAVWEKFCALPYLPSRRSMRRRHADVGGRGCLKRSASHVTMCLDLLISPGRRPCMPNNLASAARCMRVIIWGDHPVHLAGIKMRCSSGGVHACNTYVV